MKSTITAIIEEAASLKQSLVQGPIIGQIESVAKELKKRIRAGGTIYSCGNGGSACDAMHLTEELVGRFKRERPGIRAMHFMDPGMLTCWSNDYSFKEVFSRQVETFCTDLDVLIVISTSGKSANICAAAESARTRNTYTVALTGKDGGTLKGLVDEAIIIPSKSTERIQECHIMIIHALCELLETSE